MRNSTIIIGIICVVLATFVDPSPILAKKNPAAKGDQSKNGANEKKNDNSVVPDPYGSTASDQQGEVDETLSSEDEALRETSAVPEGSLRRSNRLEFDERLIKGQAAKSGAVYLFKRMPRHLPGLVPMRQSYRMRIVEPVLGRRPLLPVKKVEDHAKPAKDKKQRKEQAAELTTLDDTAPTTSELKNGSKSSPAKAPAKEKKRAGQAKRKPKTGGGE